MRSGDCTWLVVVLGVGVLGCAPKATLTRTDAARADEPAPSPDKVYDVRIDSGELQSGAAGSVSFEALPVEPWHVNLAYPTRVEFTGSPKLGVETGTLTKTDAKILDRGGISFDVPVQGVEAGKHMLEGRFLFAMCADGRDCVAVEHEFSVPVEVAAAANPPRDGS